MEAYNLWKHSTLNDAVKRGEEFLRHFPNSEYCSEVRTFLFDYYFKHGNYNTAKKYATTDDEHKKADAAEKERKRKEAEERTRNRVSKMVGSIKWHPWTTVGIEGGLPYFMGYSFNVYPFAYTSEINMRLGFRYASVFSSLFSEGDYGDSFKYDKLSPQLSMMWGGKNFYLALGARANFNSGYQYRFPVSGDTLTFTPSGLLTKLNWSLAAELMWLIEDYGTVYIFYDFDLTPAFAPNKIEAMRHDETDPHYASLNLNPWLENQFMKRGKLGIGLSINLLKGVKIY